MKPLEMIDLSVVVLHFNQWNLTKDCLVSIDAQEIPCSYEKVLVDNGSTTPLLPGWPGLAAEKAGWKIVRYEKNISHISGQNRCFESAHGEWVLFVANDVRLHQNCVNLLWNARDPKAILQPLLWTASGEVDNGGLQWRWPGYGISQKRSGSLNPDCFTSSCYLMHHQTWESATFDEALLTSHEDVDYSLLIRKAGGYIRCQALAYATHLGNATLRHQPSHNRAAFHRDRVYTVNKHYFGIDRLTRLWTINLIDGILSIIRR